MTLGEKRALKVFLCHASDDKPAVRGLYKRLSIEGVDAWLDEEKLLPGQDWSKEILEALQDSDAIVICLSKTSVAKEGYVQREIKEALKKAEEKPSGTIFVIPAKLDSCEVPAYLNTWHWVDLFEEDGFMKLLRSLKLRANVVGAAVTPFAYGDIDDETERRLDQYYTEGLAAFYTEDWNKACQRFQLILSERPGNQKAIEKFEEAERQRDLSKLYAQSVKAYQAKDWQAAIKILDELLKKTVRYKDSAELFKEAKKQKQLMELYVEAKKLHAAKKWEAVLKVFEQIFAIEPNHPDPDQLLPSAQKEAAELKRLADLNDLYRQAVREMDSGKWYEARSLLEQVHKAQTGFLETESLLRKVEDEVLKIEKINEQNNQINILYEQAHGLIRSKNWRNALDKVEEIQKLDSQFEDRDGIAEKAKTELEREGQEVQKQNQLAAMYADAVRLLKEGKYQEAMDKWDEVKVIDSKYPDRQQVQRMVNRKLVDVNKAKRSKPRNLMGRSFLFWAFVAFTSFLVVFAMASVAIPVQFYVHRLEIPADTSYGVQYQVPLTGYYTFQYVDSAYYLGLSVTTNPWNTLAYCYSGKSPQWRNGSLDETGLLFKMGSHDFRDRDAIILSTRGSQQKVHLVAGEPITCVVVGSKQSEYVDNTGKIILDVYYSLR